MRSPTRRRRAILAVLGLSAGLVPALLGASPANAGTVVTPTACTNTVQAGFSALALTVSGTASNNPQTLGGAASTLTGATFSIDVPSSTLLAGYALGLLTAGATAGAPAATNTIPAIVNVTLLGSNSAEGSVTFATYPGPDGHLANSPLTPPIDETLDNFDSPDGPGLSVSGTTVIVDPSPANKTSGDESATPLTVSATIPATTWTGTGGPIGLSLGDSTTTAIIAGGALEVGFSCSPGTLLPAGCELLPSPPPGSPPNCTGSASVPALPFDTIAVDAPPTAPVCTIESTSIGVTQSVPINLVDNCTDVNSALPGYNDIDLSTFVLDPPGAGQGSISGSAGSYTYTAPATDPGVPVVLTFHVSDKTAPTPLVSNSATLTITVLADQCTAPLTSDPTPLAPGSGDEVTGPCGLTEIVVQPVVGTTMTLDKVAGVVLMSTVVLNGQAQASSGSLQNLTVTNARGTAAGWTLSGFVSDLAAPGGPTVTLPPAAGGQTIPSCSAAGNPFGPPALQAANRLCIPGDNMGWTPASAIAHDIIFGDVAQVVSGPSDATSASNWLSQLTSAGAAGVDGIGGLQENNVLCSSPTDHSGGTFACDAALYLGVPASAGAGTYTGGLVLTLL